METRIREADILDAATITSMVQCFVASTSYRTVITTVEPSALGGLIRLVLEHGRGVVFLAEQRLAGEWSAIGMIAGLYGAHPVSGDPMVEELAWWLDPSARARTGRLGPNLLGHLESWARQKGAAVLKMVAPVEPSAHVDASSAGRYYVRHGYTPVETAYLKRL